MYENHTLLYVMPGRLDEALSIFRKSIIPELTHKPGMLGLAVVPDTQASRVVVISLWSDESCAIKAGAAQCCQASAALLGALILANNPVLKYSLT